MNKLKKQLALLLVFMFMFTQTMPLGALAANDSSDPNNTAVGNSAPGFTNNSNQAVLSTADQLSNYYLTQYKNNLGWDWLKTTNVSFTAFSGNTPQWNINTFQPLTLKDNLDNFLFAQGQYGTGNNTLNVGLGYRAMNDARSSLYGVNVFYDWQTTVQGENGYNPQGNGHMRLGAGLEYFTGPLEARLNGYVGGLTSDVQVGVKNPYTGQAAFQSVAPGMDLTIGTDFSFWDAPWLKLAATGNWYSQQHGGTINGYDGSPLYATINAYLQVTPQLQITGGGSLGKGTPNNASVGFQFNLLAPPQPALLMGDPVINNGAKTDISYKMLQPVQRNNTITVERYIKQLSPDLQTVTVNVVNSNGAKVPGAIVTLEQQTVTGAVGNGSNPNPVTANANGQAQFTVLPGSWQAYAQIGATGEKVSANPVSDTTKLVKFDLYGGYTLVGASLPSGTITAYDQHGNAVGFTYDLGNPLYRDSSGNPLLLGLNAGEKYTLKITHGGVTDVITPAYPVSASPNEKDAEVVDLTGKITESGKGSITAQVTYSDSKTPRSGTQVELLQNETLIQTATTGADGYASFGNLSLGTYQVSYNNDEGTVTNEVTLTAGQPGASLALPTKTAAPNPDAVGTITTGVIKYANNEEPADGTELKIVWQATGSDVAYTAAYVAGKGAAFTELQYGTYKLYADVPGQGYTELVTDPAELALSAENKELKLNSATLPLDKPVTGSVKLTFTANGNAALAGTKYALVKGSGSTPSEWYTLGGENIVTINNLPVGEDWYVYMKAAVETDATVSGAGAWVQKTAVTQSATTAVDVAGQYITATLQTRNIDGSAAANIAVQVFADGATEAASAQTGADGTAALSLWQKSELYDGKYTINAQISGTGAQTSVDTASQPGVITVQAELTPKLTITVKDSVAGTAVEGATVEAIPAGGTSGETVVTGSNGQAVFNLANGSYGITVTKSGYEKYLLAQVLSGVDVALEVPQVKITKANVTFTITNPNGNVAVAGATVTLDNVGPVVSIDNGQAMFSNVPNGEYQYTVMKEGYIQTGGSIVVNGEQLTPAVTFYENGGTIDGNASAGKNTVRVTLLSGSTEIGKTETSNGAYSFSNVLSGAYTLQFAADGYQAQSAQVTQGVNQQTSLAVVTLSENSGSIAGTVTDGSKPLSGVAVQLTDQNGSPINGKTTESGADGSYKISKVTSGTYKVKATLGGYENYLSEQIEQPVNTETTGKDITLAEIPGMVSGTVTATATDGTQVALADAQVNLCDENGSLVSTTTALNGGFTLSPVLAGTYKLKVTKTGYHDFLGGSFTQTVNQVRSGQDISGVTEKPGSISGTVTDGKGAVDGATMTLTQGVAVKTTTTDTNGYYSFNDGILSGTYTLKAQKDTLSKELTVKLGVNETNTTNIDFTPKSGIKNKCMSNSTARVSK